MNRNVELWKTDLFGLFQDNILQKLANLQFADTFEIVKSQCDYGSHDDSSQIDFFF